MTKTGRSINLEDFKKFDISSSAATKTLKRSETGPREDPPGQEEQELPLLPRIG